MNYRIEIGSFGRFEGNGEMIEGLLVAVVDRDKIQGRPCRKSTEGRCSGGCGEAV